MLLSSFSYGFTIEFKKIPSNEKEDRQTSDAFMKAPTGAMSARFSPARRSQHVTGFPKAKQQYTSIYHGCAQKQDRGRPNPSLKGNSHRWVPVSADRPARLLPELILLLLMGYS